MTNEEIKALLQELARSADAEGDVRSRTVRITFDRDEKKAAPKKNLWSGRHSDPEDLDEDEEETAGVNADSEADEPETDEAQAEETRTGRSAQNPSRQTESFRWEIPEEDEEEEADDWSDEDFSVIPKSSREKAKRPENYRDQKPDPQEEEEEPEEEEAGKRPKQKVRFPVEEADFESDAGDFRNEDNPDDAASDPIGDWVGRIFAGAAGRMKQRKKSAASGKKTQKETAEDGPDDPDQEEEAVSEADTLPEDTFPEEETAETAGVKSSGSGEEAEDETETDFSEDDRGEPAKPAKRTNPEEDVEPEEASEPSDRKKRTKASESAETEEPAETDEAAEPETDESGTDGNLDSEGEETSSAAAGEETDSEEEGTPRAKMSGIFQKLADRGIGGRELAMIAVGLVLLALIIAAAVNLLGNRGSSRKAEADEGMTVTVEKEPQVWCSSGEVVLKIRTDSPIQSVSVNGDSLSFTGTNKTRVSAQAQARSLDIMVVCEDGVRNAHTEIAMIDDAAPELAIRQEGEKISLTASDELSGVAGVYVGKVQGFTDVPSYEPYTEPFTPEEGVVYSCYAADTAGNASLPVVTDFTPAQELRFVQEKLSLFPGESARIKVQVFPENAWARDMTLTNSNGSVVSLDSLGNVQAVSNGTSVIEASAPGTVSARCEITVSEEAEITVSALGDVTLGDDVNLGTQNSISAAAAANGNTFFFDKVRSILSADDITFANLEGTLTTRGEREVKEYAFRGDPSYVEILKDGSIEAVTLANNHSRDYGEISLTDTQMYLDEAGIAWCLGDKIAYLEEGGAKTALIGIYVLDEQEGKAEQVEQTVREARSAGADLVVVAFHWGAEKSTYPDETQQMLAHTAINAGADLVVGHHPHVLQGIEIYEGKYIAYSLGNFCFGGNSNPSDMDTMIFQQDFRVDADHQVTDGAVRIIPCSVSSQQGWNNYQPMPVDGSEKERIKNKIIELSEQLGTPAESLLFE